MQTAGTPALGLFDGGLTNSIVDAQLKLRLSPAQTARFVDELLVYGAGFANPVLDTFLDYARSHKAEASQELSNLALCLTVPGFVPPGRPTIMLAAPPLTADATPEAAAAHDMRSFARRRIRTKLALHLCAENKCGRAHAAETVAKLSDADIDAQLAAMPTAAVAGDVGSWFNTVLTWIEQNWLPLLGALLPLLIALL